MTDYSAIQNILDWQAAHAGQVPYSETAPTRLASDSAHMLSATDCSGMVARMFKHFAGLDVGTWTGNERDYGELITTSRADAAAGRGMLPGDVILFVWSGSNPNFDHIAIYAGNGRIWNHGGPGYGPLNWSLRDNVGAATDVMVRRYIPNDTPTKEFTMDAEATAAFNALNGRISTIEKMLSGVRQDVDKQTVRAITNLTGIVGKVIHNEDGLHPNCQDETAPLIRDIHAKVVGGQS